MANQRIASFAIRYVRGRARRTAIGALLRGGQRRRGVSYLALLIIMMKMKPTAMSTTETGKVRK